MFERLDMAPPDAILGLTAAFREDPNPRKINLGVGVYQDSQGRTPVLPLSLIHISEPTRLLSISYAVFCLKKKKKQ